MEFTTWQCSLVITTCPNDCVAVHLSCCLFSPSLAQHLTSQPVVEHVSTTHSFFVSGFILQLRLCSRKSKVVLCDLLQNFQMDFLLIVPRHSTAFLCIRQWHRRAPHWSAKQVLPISYRSQHIWAGILQNIRTVPAQYKVSRFERAQWIMLSFIFKLVHESCFVALSVLDDAFFYHKHHLWGFNVGVCVAHVHIFAACCCWILCASFLSYSPRGPDAHCSAAADSTGPA